MISLYSGTPGSGKSLHCADTIIRWSRLGYPVIGNFTVDLSRYKRADYIYCPNDQMTPEFLIEFSRNRFGSKPPKEGSILLVIDECQLLFNAREWQQSGRARWLSFFTQHRKLGYDIILIAQFDRMIDRQIRSLIEYEYVHRKMSNFGWQGVMLSLFFGGRTFIAVKMWYPLNEKIGSEIFHARKYLFRIYDSYATFDAGSEKSAAAPELPKKESESDPDSDPEVKQGELVDLAPRHPIFPSLRPWNDFSLCSFQGKFLRPGGRSETGW